MKVSRVAIAILSLSLSAPAFAAFKTGDDLHEICTVRHKGGARLTFVLGYVSGVYDSFIFMQDMRRSNGETVSASICTGEQGLSAGDAADIACEYLKENVQHRKYNAATVVIKSLSEAFPCY